jgi:hypothetical protein
MPLYIAQFEETKLEHSVHSEDHAVEIDRPRIEKDPCISIETTQSHTSSSDTSSPDTSSSDLATLSVEMSDEGDLPSKEGHVEPIEHSEPVEPSLGVRSGNPPSIDGAIVGWKGPDPEGFGYSAQSVQPAASSTVRSYAKVGGKWVLPNEEGNNTPNEGQKPARNSAEASRSETRTGVRSLANITGDQSFPLPEPDREFATASSELDSNTSQNNPNVQANGPTTEIKKVNGAKLLSQLEHFLKESGSLRSDKKPIKFKDALGRKFSFPFELIATWAVSVKFTSCML